MGLDIGDKRIGVALSDPDGVLASPFTIIERRDDRLDIEAIAGIVGQYQVEQVILAVNYLPEAIQDYFGDIANLGVRITYVLEDTPLGTAGAVKNAERYLDSTFVVLNGDIFTDLDVADMLAFHQRKRARATIALTWVDNPCAFGVVETASDGRVQRFTEKPSPDRVTTHWINAGIYILEPEVLNHVPPDTNYMFEHGLFPLLLKLGEPVYGYPSHGYWLDMGTLEKYLCLNCDLLLTKTTSYLTPKLNREGMNRKADTIIHPTARVTEPVAIGNRCRIDEGAHIIGPVVIGDDCHIGAGAYLESSILWDTVSLSAGSSYQRCVICHREGKEQVINCDSQ